MIWFNLDFVIFVSYRGMWYISIKIVGKDVVKDMNQRYAEAVAQRCGSIKNMFLEISQKSQENICARDSTY